MRRGLLSILFLLFVAQTIFAQNEVAEPVEQYESVETEAYVEAKEYKEIIPDWDLRELDDSKWKKLKNEKRFIYKKEKPKKEKEVKEREPWLDGLGEFFSSTGFKIFLYVLLATFLLYVIYLFFKNNDISFRRNVKDEIIEQEDPWEDVRSFDDWEIALQKAIKEGDYRLATRIYYLHTLNILDRQGLVLYKEDKTNWFYVQKLYGSPLHDSFKELTTSFDYIWYGEYAINQTQFEQLETSFKNFHTQIK